MLLLYKKIYSYQKEKKKRLHFHSESKYTVKVAWEIGTCKSPKYVAAALKQFFLLSSPADRLLR